MYKYPDIYFLPEWGNLYAENDKGGLEKFYFENERGIVFYQFVKRNIPSLVKGRRYYDIVTPYGFGGPIVLECEEQNKKELLNGFEKAFNTFCENESIVSEYVRFSPWEKNYLDFNYIYEIIPNKNTFAINLEVEDIFMNEISSKRRNLIRKAKKNCVELEYDFEGKSIDEFLRLYQLTIEKNNISEYYRFKKEFIKKHFNELQNKIFILNAKYEDKYISSAMFLHHQDNMHYHLSANDPQYYRLNANSYILLEAAEWGQRNRKKQLHLGGASSSIELATFKQSFTKQMPYDFFVGRKIRNMEVYNELCALSSIKSPSYFPAYRG